MDRIELKSLSLVAKMMAHIQTEDEALVDKMVLSEGKDSKRLFTGTIRTTIYERDHGTCFYCGQEVVGTFHVDHVIPFVLGGRTVEENGVVSCPKCNLKKGKKVW